MSRQTLYDSIKKIREQDRQPYNRILIAGYLNDDEVKASQIDPQAYLRDSMENYVKKITGYLYIKGNFYLHLLQSKDMNNINSYLNNFLNSNSSEYKKYHTKITVVYQTYENADQFFKSWDCDCISAPGPVLVDTDKTQQQILDRSFEIYENLQDGAKKKRDNPSHKIANMFLLSNDDMAILICDQFMTIQQYAEIYLKEQIYSKQAQQDYPLPPSIFSIMDYLQIQDYTKFGGK